MKIKSVYIDGLHNAINKTYQFNDMVYLFGHNGAGKSTVLQAIQFALLGYIPGTAKNSKEALLRHSPTDEIDVKLTLIDDTNTEILVRRKINKAGNTLSTFPENYDLTPIISGIELPIFNFNEFVSISGTGCIASALETACPVLIVCLRIREQECISASRS
jgi:DNA repair exonuclease SbcCD ATPase subunit